QYEARGRRQVERIQPFDKTRRAIGLPGLHHLHDELASANGFAGLPARAQPGRTVMPSSARIGAHIRRAAETGDPVLRGRGAVALRVDLQRAAYEEVTGILSGDLGQR